MDRETFVASYISNKVTARVIQKQNNVDGYPVGSGVIESETDIAQREAIVAWNRMVSNGYRIPRLDKIDPLTTK